MSQHPWQIGTQVVVRRPTIDREGKILHPSGAVAMITQLPSSEDRAYRVRFIDGLEERHAMEDVVLLSDHKAFAVTGPREVAMDARLHQSLHQRVILRCVIGSRAYGLDSDQSDTDYRGIFLPTAAQHWSLTGVPDQLESHELQQHFWELQRFLVLALKANPSALETLFTPLIEFQTPLASELIAIRRQFLSKLLYQTYCGYVLSQFKKMQAHLRETGQVKWKHAMHLIRLQLAGVEVLREGVLPIRVDAHRDRLLEIKRGEWTFEQVDRWRRTLQLELDQAFAASTLPDQPDYQAADAFLLRARQQAVGEGLP
jgi:uncharacterized protein